MRSQTFPQLTVGILGGGQLARMMVLKGHELGLKMAVLSPHHTDPAAQVTAHWFQGNLDSPRDLDEFLRAVQVATFESEFLDADILSTLVQSTKTPVYPLPSTIGRLQDRLTQKELLLKNKLPTADFRHVTSWEDVQAAYEELDKAVVFKKRRFGYDGYGTFVVRKPQELAAFRSTFEEEKTGFIVEEFVPFKRELAIIIARRASGEVVTLPFVQSYQKDNRCLWIKGPIRSTRLKPLENKLKAFLKHTGYVGVMGIELFETHSGYLINEIAPRVHNSGHYSQNALIEDQFALHLKAILNMPFAKVELVRPAFCMLNLLGSSEKTPRWILPSDVHMHWYGKHDNRKGRKMGHVNVLASTPDAALKKALKSRLLFEV